MQDNMKIDYLDIDKIKPYKRNAKKHPQEQIDQIVKSIEQFGNNDPIAVWGDKNIIVEGHGRYLALKQMGVTGEIPVIHLDHLTDDERRVYGLVHNKLTMNSGFDYDILETEFNLIDPDEFDLGFYGFFDDDEEPEKAPADIVEDEVPDLDKVESVCKRGQIWQLGTHRLMCGDSTDADDVERLMNGEKADMVFTDPPYGMFLDTDYDEMFSNDETHKKTGKRFSQVIGDHEDFSPELINTIFENFSNTPEIFIWGADYFSELIPNRRDGSWICWDKRCDETMDKVVGNTFELCFSKKKHKRLVARILWSGYHGMNGSDSGIRLHPTQKPVKLVGWFFERYGKAGEIVADLFGGSGTTMIACEQLDRRCFMMEISPHYCDVIIKRWEDFTGRKAELIEE